MRASVPAACFWLLPCLAVVPLVVCVACASGERVLPHPSIERMWNDFIEMPGERALAIAGDPNRGYWVGAAAGGEASQAEAEESALARCRERRRARRMQEPCLLYAVGSHIVWESGALVPSRIRRP